jgi:glucose uptake protein
VLLPGTATAVWLALIGVLICWGSWASLFKSASKARFEFFAYDFSFGVVLASVIAAFTLGSWNNSDLTFQDNFVLISGRKLIVAFGSGLVFGIANILLLGSVSVGGMTVAFPIAFGIAWAILGVWNSMYQPDVNRMPAFGGAATVLIAIVVNIMAYRWYLAGLQAKDVQSDPRKNPPRSGKGAKAVGLAFFSGLLLAVFFPLLGRATVLDAGLAPYGAALVISAGVVCSSILFIPFFLNFPVKGQALTVRRYFKIEKRQHLYGLIGGMVWTAGLLAVLSTDALPSAIQIPPVAAYMLVHSAPVLAALWGLLVWRETAGASTRVHMMTAAMLVLLLMGMGMIASAPVYGN